MEVLLRFPLPYKLIYVDIILIIIILTMVVLGRPFINYKTFNINGWAVGMDVLLRFPLPYKLIYVDIIIIIIILTMVGS